MKNLTLLFLMACSPTVQGKAFNFTKTKRVAVVGKGYTQGIESALLAHGSGKVQILARKEQAEMNTEKQLQYGGDFSDDAVVGLGRQLGAEMLFVVRDEVKKNEVHEQPSVENCSFRYGDSSIDNDEQKAKNKAKREECEKNNVAERKRAAEAPPRIFHSYSTHVRLVDITTGELAAFADATVDDGQAGMTCSYPCTKDKASDLAVRAILGLPTKD